MRTPSAARVCVVLMSWLAIAGTWPAFAQNSTPLPAQKKAICLLHGLPPPSASYSVIKKLQVGKGSYGSVSEVLIIVADQARALGADAIIEYTGSQRFGFFPWRMVRPVVRGTAIQWTSTAEVDCVALGGTYN